MTHYRKTIGSLNYNTHNIPGAGSTRVSIANDPKSYIFNPDEQTWATSQNFDGTPDLPAEQLEALEAALLEHTVLRRAWFEEQGRLHALYADKSKILKTITTYDDCEQANASDQTDHFIRRKICDDGDWFSYTTKHSNNTTVHTQRRLSDEEARNPSLATKALTVELEDSRAEREASRNRLFQFEDAHQNPAGFDLNKRVTAVYQLTGFIHQTFRNHPDYPTGKPHWQYIQQDGTLSSFESEVSAFDVQKQLIENTQTHS